MYTLSRTALDAIKTTFLMAIPRERIRKTIMSENLLIKRLEALEEKNRHLRRMNLATFLMSFLLFSLAFCQYMGIHTIPFKAVYAQSFFVQDSKGQIRAELSNSNDITLFSIYDNNNQPRLAMSLTQDEPGLHVYDYQGIRRAALGIGGQGPSLMFMNSAGMELSGLITRRDGTTDLLLDELGAGREIQTINEQTSSPWEEDFAMEDRMNRAY